MSACSGSVRTGGARRRIAHHTASLLAILASLPGPAAAQQRPPAGLGLDPDKPIHQYGREMWTVKDGLPSPTIRDIVQDGDGYLWLATHNGLARFDGARFAVFDPANTPAMTSSMLVDLMVGRDGTLWIGSRGGGLTRLRHGAFTTYTDHDGLAGNHVTRIAEDGGGRVWVVANGALHRFLDGALFAVPVPDSAASAEVRHLTVDRDGDLWVATVSGLYRHDGDGFEAAGPTGAARGVAALYADADGDLWVAAPETGLVRYHEGGTNVFTVADGLGSSRLSALLRDGAGTLWIGLARGGLQRLVAGAFQRPAPNRGPSDDRVQALYEDREGNLWVGTYNGLIRYSDGSVTTFAEIDGWQGGQAAAVLEDRDGNVWVGGDAGLSRLSAGRWTRPEDPVCEAWGEVTSIAEDLDGALWFGTRTGLHRHPAGQPSAHERFTVETGLRADAVTAVQPSTEGGVWVSTDAGGTSWLHRVRGDRLSVVDSLAVETRWIHEDRDGRVWWGTDAGLFRLEDAGAMPVYEGVIRGAALEAVHEDDAGVLWIGTVGRGLVRIAADSVASYRVADGLYDDTIWAIVEDERRNLWMSTDRGVFRLSRDHVTAFDEGRAARMPWVSYGHGDGLTMLEGFGLGHPSGWFARDGSVWFTLWDGVARVSPRRSLQTALFAPAIIETFHADGESVPLRDGVRLPGDKRQLEFRFTAVRLRHGDRARFRYKLVGLDEGWIDADATRSAVYSAVPHGDYEFQVVADNGGSGWGEVGTAFAFSVAPLFHETLWFRALVGLGIVLALSYAYRRRTRAVRARAEDLEREVDDREEALEALTRSEQRLSHVLEASPEGIILVNTAGTITFANERAKRLFGYADASLVGVAAEAILPDCNYAAHAPRLAALQAESDDGPLDLRVESRGVRRDGGGFSADVSLGVVATGDAPLLICAVREVGAARVVVRETSP